ncbi:hypothetical protein [Actinomadura sp. DC4]|uniref:hypothetical protein n=1 Tax=Actinomadura sp. DC4 TaxID=3055069 RepID=UPI0025B02E1C|nr:hypothetical protein [Actinomadura sp. DC4]MDN3356110.1 hypothetical protein [Actinomadura sp. DC4]
MRGVARACRVLTFVLGVFAVLWMSAYFSVTLPLAIPIVLIGIILALVAVMFRRPPAGLFPATEPEPEASPASTAIPMPPIPEPPAPSAAWMFDEPEPDGEDW